MRDQLRGILSILRLFWRPIAVAYVWMLVVVTVVPSFRLGDDAMAALIAWGHTAPTDLGARVLLACSASLSLASGLIVSVGTSELNVTLFGRLLPDVARYHRLGATWLGALLALGILLVGSGISSAQTALLAALLSPAWFALGLAVSLAGVYWRIAAATSVIVSGVFFYPSVYADLVRSYGALSLTGAAAVVMVLQRRMYSASGRRASFERWSERLHGQLQTDAHDAPRHMHAIAKRGTPYWTLAALAEFPRQWGARRGWWRFAMFNGSFMACFVYLWSGAQIGLIGMSLAQAGLQLSNTVLYPLTRRERATVRFCCALLESVVVFCTMGVAFLILHALHVPHSLIVDPKARPFPPFGYLVLSAFAFSPIAQLARPVAPPPVNTVRLARFGFALTYMIGAQLPAMLWYRHLTERDPLLPYAVMAVVAVAMQAAHYLVLQRIYRRANLLPIE